MSGKVLKYSQTEPRELKVVETQKVLNKLKDSQPLWVELIKNVGKLTQHLENNAPYAAVHDSLEKIADHCGGDIEGGFRSVLACQVELMEQNNNVRSTWSRNVYDEYMEKDPSSGYGKSNRLEADKQRMVSFFKDFSTNRASSLKTVKKAESEYNKANKKKVLKKDPSKSGKAAEQLKEMIDSHNEFLSDELKSIALIERKKYLALLKQMNVVLDSQARALEASLQKVKKTQESIAQLLSAEEEENLPQSLKDVIASGPSLVDKKTGDVNVLDGSGSFVKPPPSLGSFDLKESKDDLRLRSQTDSSLASPPAARPSSATSPPPPSAAVISPAERPEDSLDSYLNALNESASFFTPIKDSDDESEEESSSDDDNHNNHNTTTSSSSSHLNGGGDPAALQVNAAEGDALHSLLQSFEGDRSVYVDRLN